MNQFKINIFLLSSLLLIIVFSCKDKWEDHSSLNYKIADGSVWDQIKQDNDLTTFAECIVKAGYDKILSSSKAITVWAPTNAALSSIDNSWLSDSAKLKSLVGHHIAYQQYFSDTPLPDSVLQVKMLDGKCIYLQRGYKMIESANVVMENLLTKNGVLHKIDKPVLPRKSIWEYFTSSSKAQTHKNFLTTLMINIFDPTKATIIGVDSAARNVYDTLSGTVPVNLFLNKVRDLTDERKNYTFFMLSDDAFNSQYLKYQPYYKNTNLASSDSLISWNVCNDLVVDGKYHSSALKDTMLSATNVKLPIDKSAIIDSFEASNGMVYVLNKCDIPIKEKIKPIIIEAESNWKRDTLVKNGTFTKLVYSIRKNDSIIWGSRYISWSGYSKPNAWMSHPVTVNSIKYTIYWVAYRPTSTNMQTFSIIADKVEKVINTLDQFNVYKESRLGEFTFNNAGEATIKVTSDGTNPIFLDYIKLVPVLQ